MNRSTQSTPRSDRPLVLLPARHRSSLALILAVLLSSLSSSAGALEWGLRFGLHDLYVEKQESHTRGVHAGIFFDHTTKSKISMFGSLDVLVDNDKDELDPDHVPVWFMGRFSAERKAVDWGEHASLNWLLLDGSGRRNTASSIEKTVKLMPGIETAFGGEKASADIKLVAGYYMSEIDDDIPLTRGYQVEPRDLLRNTTFAFSLAADARIALGRLFALTGKAQQWHDGDEELENHFALELIYDSGALIKGSRIVLHVERNEWNLDPFANTPLDDIDYMPILPWKRDAFVRLSIDIPKWWGRRPSS